MLDKFPHALTILQDTHFEQRLFPLEIGFSAGLETILQTLELPEITDDP